MNMKVQLSVCAVLPVATACYCSVKTDSGDDLGKTEEVTEKSANPTWKKVFLFDYNEAGSSGKAVSIRIHDNSNGEIGTATFDVGAVMKSKGSAMAKTLDGGGGGGTICVRVVEQTVQAGLKLQLHGWHFQNMEGFMNKSDPFFEIKDSSSQGDDVIYRSQVLDNNLSPLWPETEIEIIKLCGGVLDKPLTVLIGDRDANYTVERMGQFETSVNGLLSASLDDSRFDMKKAGRKTGEISVVVAKLTGDFMERMAKGQTILEGTAAVYVAKELVEQKTKEGEPAQTLAKEKGDAAAKAAGYVQNAERVVSVASEAAKSAAEKEKAVEGGIAGTLQLQLRGKKFKNMEGFMNKSDPFFEIKGVNGNTIYTSNVLENNLNPVWPQAEVQIAALCGGDLDKPVTVVIGDRDANGTIEHMGQFEMSTNGFISAVSSGRNDAIEMKKDGKTTGEIHVMRARLDGYADLKEEAKKAQAKLDESKAALKKFADSAAAAAKEAESAKSVAGKNTKEVEAAKKKLEEAEAVLGSVGL